MKLYKNKYFNSCWVGGAIISLVVASIIVSNNELRGCLQVQCFSSFLDIFDLPIKIATAGLTLAGVVAIIHRSEQTRKQIDISLEQISISSEQIKISLKQNEFKNFIDHKNEFIKVVKLLEIELEVTIQGKNNLYRRFYPINTPHKVEFISEGSNGEDSNLLCIIEQHNKLVNDYNEMLLNDSSGKITNPKGFARWLSSYLILIAELGTSTENKGLVQNKNYVEFFNPEVIEFLPCDIEKFINSNSDILKGLSYFCFPNNAENISIMTANPFPLANTLIDMFLDSSTK